MSRNLIITIAMLTVTAGAATAATVTFTVDRWDDSMLATACTDTSSNDCSLRGAVLMSNQSTAGQVEIVFDTPGDPVHHWIWLDATSSGPIVIDRGVKISGGNQVTIASRLRVAFSIVDDARVTFEGIELRGHTYLGDPDPDRRAFFVSELASLSVVDCTVTRFRNITCPVVVAEGYFYAARSTFSFNTHRHSAEGAAICGSEPNDSFSPAGDIRLNACTLSHNSSAGAGVIWSEGDVFLTHVTVVENTSERAEIVTESVTDVVVLTNTIIAGRCSVQTTHSGGGNVESPGDTCGLDPAIDQPGVSDVQLLPLGDYGGPTLTHMPHPRSPAVDDPLNVISLNGHYDQRQLYAPADGNGDGIERTDAGAIERQPGDIVCPATADIDEICVLDARDIVWAIMLRAGEPGGLDDDCTGDGVFDATDHPCVIDAVFADT